MLQLLILEMKAYIEKAETGDTNAIDLKLGALIRAHSLEVEKMVKGARAAEKRIAQEQAE